MTINVSAKNVPVNPNQEMVNLARHQMVWGSMADSIPVGKMPNLEQAAHVAGMTTCHGPLEFASLSLPAIPGKIS